MRRAFCSFVVVISMIEGSPCGRAADIKEAADAALKAGRKAGLAAFRTPLPFTTRNPTGELRGDLCGTEPDKALEVSVASIRIDPATSGEATATVDVTGPVRLKLQTAVPASELVAEGTVTVRIGLRLEPAGFLGEPFARVTARHVELAKSSLVVAGEGRGFPGGEAGAKLRGILGRACDTAMGQGAGGWLVAMNGAIADEAPALKLGEELPPPRPVEDQFTALLVKGAVKSMADAPGSPTRRDQHPAHQGCVRARFTVAGDLPERLRVGIFREPRTYDAVIRYSNGGSSKDNVPDAHGMAIKLLGVEGPYLLDGPEDAGTQDFILISHPVFFAKDPKDLFEFTMARRAREEAIAAKDDKKAAEIFEKFRTQFILFASVAKLGTPSPLEMTFHSMVPYRLGGLAVKYSAVPAPENADGRPALTKDSPDDALRQAMVERLTTNKKPATFTFRVHVQSDPVKMPVEDPTVDWGAEPVAVATITIPPQDFAGPEQLKFCENLAFTPWHGIEAHRPIGGIGRARKPVYQATSAFRHEKNGIPRKEPTVADLDRVFGAAR